MKRVYLNNMVTTKLKSMAKMFFECDDLEYIYMPKLLLPNDCDLYRVCWLFATFV